MKEEFRTNEGEFGKRARNTELCVFTAFHEQFNRITLKWLETNKPAVSALRYLLVAGDNYSTLSVSTTIILKQYKCCYAKAHVSLLSHICPFRHRAAVTWSDLTGPDKMLCFFIFLWKPWYIFYDFLMNKKNEQHYKCIYCHFWSNYAPFLNKNITFFEKKSY